ncbi:MAG: RpiB/LacA/LacB family sugar-phosphate isomerase, partial [Anaerolineales bacterium]|nr:RpiB/LacA/LacB family sugar-phosphate isomerase [Anaerolineales bacterium]
MDEETIREMVRRVVHRTLGMPAASRPTNARPLVTELDVQAVPVGGQFRVEPGALVTPLARQVAAERRVTLETSGPDPRAIPAGGSPSRRSSADPRAIAIGADHGGFELKEMLGAYLEELGYSVVDCGTDSGAAVDYPDLALAVARLVAQGS